MRYQQYSQLIFFNSCLAKYRLEIKFNEWASIPAERFIQNQQLRHADQCTCKHDSLLLSAGKRSNLSENIILHFKFRQCRINFFFGLSLVSFTMQVPRKPCSHDFFDRCREILIFADAVLRNVPYMKSAKYRRPTELIKKTDFPCWGRNSPSRSFRKVLFPHPFSPVKIIYLRNSNEILYDQVRKYFHRKMTFFQFEQSSYSFSESFI